MAITTERRRRPLFGRGTADEWIEAHSSDAAQTFRHSGWRATRDRVVGALELADVPPARLRAFANCGSHAFLLESTDEPGHYRITSSKCKDRFCKPCARERAGRVSRNLLEYVDGRELRFVTLTLATKTTDLRSELDRLYSSFQHLRTRAFWKRHVVGGAAMLEVKYNQTSDRWHPHLHILVEGRYVPKARLQTEWRHVTGDSFIVDIAAVKDHDRVTHYICKYATDPIDRSIGGSTNLLSQAIIAFRGRKTCLTFGTWRGVVLLATDDAGGWKRIASLNKVLSQAKRGDEDAQRIINSLWVYDESHAKGGNDTGGPRGPPMPTLYDVPF